MTFGVERVAAMMNIFVFFFLSVLGGGRRVVCENEDGIKKRKSRHPFISKRKHEKSVWIFVADKFMQDGSRTAACAAC